MSVRWIEGFETWGNLNDLRAVWQDHFYGKYSPAFCEDGSAILIEGYNGIGLAYAGASRPYNYFSVSIEQRQVWTVGFAYKVPAVTYVNGENVLKIMDGITHQLQLEVFLDAGSGSEIKLNRNNTAIDSLGFYPPDEWIFIEIQCNIHNSTGSYECRVNGAVVCSDTNVDTQYSSNAYAALFQFGFNTGAYDDIYILDDDASGQNDFLGAVKVKRALPVSDSSVQWTRSAGVNNYANVDEVPPSLTDYNYSKTTSQLDLFGFQAISDDLLGAQLNVSAKLSEPGGKTLTLVCDSNASQQTDDVQLGDSEFATVYALPLDNDPDTSVLWTKTGFNAATWGVKVG